ncbi:phosphatidate cytidylyltransferase, mitochondrial isoform X2 [Callorhinchus milii]|uniref:phosphatidate cytidylyltransferase, mitochondrial isoform X2 n=1 Tax=Callorhinchus milii TaxID=7868 RepID=UPI001C3FC7E5|nr:phosphatidate cytidylyltransferase, mitochondrial isoform X2 [Callorhinchus milii]
MEGIIPTGGRLLGKEGMDRRLKSVTRNMLDFVFAVDNPLAWHTMNMMKNRKHYSFLRFLGPKYVSRIQDNYGAGVYYNALIPCDERLIKYGVISTDTLIDDLLHWKTLYVAGRLHKPVKIVIQSENSKLQAALSRNLRSALVTAFLTLPESFSEEELFLRVTGLSYSGDFRMLIGEDRAKVPNIVRVNMENFQRLYSPLLQECPHALHRQQQGIVELDKSAEGQFRQLMSLPRTLQQQITRLVDRPGKNRDVEEILLQVAQDPECGAFVQLGVAAIVKTSSLMQSAKGILTAGARKTVVYSTRKLWKMWRSWPRHLLS